MSEETTIDAVGRYWLEHYAAGHCTLCANYGYIDSRGLTTPGGANVGRLNYCICPNGRALRGARVNLEPMAAADQRRRG